MTNLSKGNITGKAQPSLTHKKHTNALFAATALLISFSGSQAFAAHCFADVSISNGPTSFNVNKNWDRRTNGKKWRQVDGSHRSECDNHGANHFNTLDLEALAKEQGMCGTITATGTSWIGTSRKKGNLGPKTVTIPCDPNPPISETSIPSDFQYASKVICGQIGDSLTINGDYRAVVNIHNPNYEPIEFRYKFASAKAAEDGEISNFIDSEIGPDGAQYFTCEQIQEFAGQGSEFDGFFVVESREPLDVVTYYTAGSEETLTSVDIERTYERKITDNRQWSCGNQTVDLATAWGWTRNGLPATRVQTANGNPIDQFGPYRMDGMDVWLSDTANITSQQQPGDHDYQLDFCVCGNTSEYQTAAVVNVAALRADNSVTANIDGGSPFITGQNAHSAGTPGSGNAQITTPGTHYLQFKQNNSGSYHAVGFSGTVSLQNGYLGSCR